MKDHLSKRYTRLFIPLLIIASLVLFGCKAGLDLAMTGAGKSAQVENIGFFKTTDDLKSNQSGGPGLPDLYYIAPNVNWKKYKNVIVPDFTSMTSDISKISGLQLSEFKNLRQDIPDNIARSIDGSIFRKCVRSDQRIDPNDIKEIKDLKADAILFGNISEFKTGLRSKSGNMLVTTQVEIKLVDRKSGQEIIKIIDRRSTDSDKVSMPIVRYLANVMKAAKNSQQVNNTPDTLIDKKPDKKKAKQKTKEVPQAASSETVDADKALDALIGK